MGGRDRAARAVRRGVAVHRAAVQPGPRAVGAEQLVPERMGRHQQQPRPLQHALEAERGEQLQRTRQRREARQHRLLPGAEVLEVRADEPPPRLAVPGMQGVERGGGLADVARERHRAPVRQRMRVAVARMDPAQPVALERPAGEDGRGGGRGIDRRPRVMAEPGQRELLGGDRAADVIGGLEHRHHPPGLRQRDRGGEPVGPAADDDRRVAHAPAPPSASAIWCSMLSSTSLVWPQNACWASRPARR